MNTKIHILIIDSDADTLKACQEILAPWKDTTVTTCDSLAAMDTVGACAPDLVLIEMVMHGRDGIELLREIKRMSPQIKVIAMSGGGALLTSEFVLRLARGLGADSIISKPVEPGPLLEAIETALSPLTDRCEGESTDENPH